MSSLIPQDFRGHFRHWNSQDTYQIDKSPEINNKKNQFIKTKSAKLVVWRGYWKNWRSVANVSLPRHRKKYQYGQDLMKGSWIDRWPLSYSLLASRGAHPGALFKNISRYNKISRVCLPPIKRDAERSINIRAVARSENPGGLVVLGGDNVSPWSR